MSQYGPYATRKVLSASEQSAVYTAEHTTTGRIVILRVTTISGLSSENAMQDCKDIVRDIQDLEIPNSVKIEDFGSTDSRLYIAMNALSGGTLLDRMKRRMLKTDTPILPSPADVLLMTERLITAIDAMHGLGLVHGQITPESIRFNDRGQAFLGEIGLTRILKVIYNLEATNSFNMSRYSPPELWQGERPSPATDQYALACIVYQLLTSIPPFNGKSIFDLMQAHTNDTVAPPHHINGELPEDLSMVFWRALAKDVDRRYPSIRDFYQDLRLTFTGYPMQTTDFFKFKLD